MKYTIREKKNPEKTKEIEMSISEVDAWKEANPKWEIVIGAPFIHSGLNLGLKSSKSEDVFKDKLREISKKNPGNTLKNYVNI